MSGLTIELGGIDKVLEKLDTGKFERDISDELIAFGADVSRDAKINVEANGTTDNGFLVNSIDFKSTAPLTVEIFAAIDYAAYVEFGTGPYAAAYVPSLEPGWQLLAKEFYINGKGRMAAQPYLYPAYEKNRIELIKRLKNLLNA